MSDDTRHEPRPRRDPIELLDDLLADPDTHPHTSALELERRLSDAEQVPSARLRARFYRTLADEQQRLERPGLGARLTGWWLALWPARPAGQMLLTAALVLATLAAGVAIGSGLTDPVGFTRTADSGTGRDAVAPGEAPSIVPTVDAGPSPTTTPAENRAALELLTRELRETQEVLALSLLEHPSASERLRGVSLGRRSLEDRRVVQALLDALQYDGSENVRLAALEALTRRIERPEVQDGLLDALPRQTSPMLQVALGDTVAAATDDRGRVAIGRLLENRDLDEGVRRHLEGLVTADL